MSQSLPVFSNLLARGFEIVFDLVKSVGLAGVHWSIPAGLAQRLPADRPVVLFGNHSSNWDGFLYRDLQKKLRPGMPIYSLMLERELRRLPLFRALGGIGIDSTSPGSVARALRSARALRGPSFTSAGFFFSVFPQGSTYPAGKRPLGFQEGLRHFAKALGPVTLLPVALQFELLGSVRPHAFVSVGEPIAVPESAGKVIDLGSIPSLDVLEAQVTALLDGLNADLSARGEAAVSIPGEATVSMPGEAAVSNVVGESPV